MGRMEGKVAVVTGGGRGIGKSTCKVLAADFRKGGFLAGCALKIKCNKAGGRSEVALHGRNGAAYELRMADAYRRMNQTAKKNNRNH